MKQFYTYLHCKPNGEPFYVGIGHLGGDGHSRRSHNFFNRNQHHKNIVAKYGKDNILIYEFPCCSKEQAFLDEIQQIAQLRAESYNLANKSSRGEMSTLGYKPSALALARMSAFQKGRKKSAEHRVKIGAANKGRKQSIEQLAKLSLVRRGRVVSTETRLKLSLAHTGKSHPPSDRDAFKRQRSEIQKSLWKNPEYCEKMRLAHTGTKSERMARSEVTI